MRRPWTPEEDAALRKACARRSRRQVKWEPIAQQLGRSVDATRCRACRLDLMRPARHWTPEEDAYLLREWADNRMRTLQEHLPGRSAQAIRQRASALGLSAADRRQGLLSVKAAARLTGFADEALVALLERQGVTTRITAVCPKGPRFARRYVSLDAVVAAIARDLQTESAVAAARRLGVTAAVVRSRLHQQGYFSVRGRPFRLAPETYDQLVARAA